MLMVWVAKIRVAATTRVGAPQKNEEEGETQIVYKCSTLYL
jgi:hypothetical protein